MDLPDLKLIHCDYYCLTCLIYYKVVKMELRRNLPKYLVCQCVSIDYEFIFCPKDILQYKSSCNSTSQNLNVNNDV